MIPSSPLACSRQTCRAEALATGFGVQKAEKPCDAAHPYSYTCIRTCGGSRSQAVGIPTVGSVSPPSPPRRNLEGSMDAIPKDHDGHCSRRCPRLMRSARQKRKQQRRRTYDVIRLKRAPLAPAHKARDWKPPISPPHPRARAQLCIEGGGAFVPQAPGARVGRLGRLSCALAEVALASATEPWRAICAADALVGGDSQRRKGGKE